MDQNSAIFFLYHPELGNESLGCSDFWVFRLNFSLNSRANFKQFPVTFRYGIHDVFVAFENVPKQRNLVGI